MSSRANAAKWVGKWLLEIPVYLATSYMVRELIGSCYRLLLKAGANLPPNFLLRHFLWVSFLGGLIAGLIGIVVFRALLLLPIHSEPASGGPWTRPQAWTWVLPTCWLAFGMMAWLGSHAPHSVLMASGSVAAPGILDVFFGARCSFSAGYSGHLFLADCMKQITFTHPWMGTLGYSAAAFVPVGRFWSASSSEGQISEPEHTGEVEA